MKYAGWWALSAAACIPVVLAGQWLLGLAWWQTTPLWLAVLIYHEVMSYRDRRYGGSGWTDNA